MNVGCVSAIDSNGRTIWIADAHRGDGKHFVMGADQKTDCVSGTGGGDLARGSELAGIVCASFHECENSYAQAEEQKLRSLRHKSNAIWRSRENIKSHRSG